MKKVKIVKKETSSLKEEKEEKKLIINKTLIISGKIKENLKNWKLLKGPVCQQKIS